MWESVPQLDFQKKLKKLLKRHRQETKNALDNLAAYLEDLRSGLRPQQIIRGYLHSEGRGVWAVDQSGPKNPRKAIRLYFFPEEKTCELHVLTIGDKDSQRDDVKACHQFVDSIRKQWESINDKSEPKAIQEDLGDGT